MDELKITQEKLAEKLDLSPATINKILNSKTKLQFDTLIKIVDILETTLANLTGTAIDDKNNFDLNILSDRLRIKGFSVQIFKEKEKAIEYILNKCKDKPIGLGSNLAFNEMGLTKAFEKNDVKFQYASETSNDKVLEKEALNSPIFILSVSGISYESAEMVNISGNNSRIAGSLCCADEIIFVIGKNKIANDLSGAIEKTKEGYISTFAKLSGLNTPCAETGKCSTSCNSADMVCKTTCIYHASSKKTINTIILIDENIGY